MKNTRSSHQPFEQIPVEARGLLFIYASAALASYQSHPPRYSELIRRLETVWDVYRLTYEDLADSGRMMQLLIEHFAPLPESSDDALRQGEQ